MVLLHCSGDKHSTLSSNGKPREEDTEDITINSLSLLMSVCLEVTMCVHYVKVAGDVIIMYKLT